MNFKYEFINNNQQQTIMLLHGFLSSRESMRKIAEDLNGHRNVILVDLPGFGGTSSIAVEYSMEDITSQLIKITDALALKTIDVLGYSMGGRVALALTCSYPERIAKCILESASPGIQNKDAKRARLEVDKKRAGFIVSNYEVFLKEWQSMPLFETQQRVDTSLLKAQHRERLQQKPDEAADSLLKYGTGVQGSYWEELDKLSNEVCLIVGSEDKKFVRIAESMSESFKNAKLNIVEDCGHNIHLENYQAYINLVLKYLEEDNS